ncbi:hypothetical protein TNCV_4380591 [Trichonephila clavipes]|nr:hypothetical protein TNCV_4380591 [Trichonephila clavipes]
MKRLRRVRPQYAPQYPLQYEQQESCIYVHNNACTRTANIVKQLLEKKEVMQYGHPPCSIDLNTLDFFLFP